MAKRKENKSAKIREYLAANPEATTSDAAKATSATPTQVSNVRRQLARGPVGKRGRPAKSAAAVTSGGLDLVGLIKANEFVRSIGGNFKAAEQLIVALAKIKA